MMLKQAIYLETKNPGFRKRERGYEFQGVRLDLSSVDFFRRQVLYSLMKSFFEAEGWRVKSVPGYVLYQRPGKVGAVQPEMVSKPKVRVVLAHPDIEAVSEFIAAWLAGLEVMERKDGVELLNIPIVVEDIRKTTREIKPEVSMHFKNLIGNKRA